MLEIGGRCTRLTTSRGNQRRALFGGNSNWRGPIWFPVNFLLVESLQRFHYYLGDDFTVECPTGSGQMMTLNEVAAELSRRLARPFLQDATGRRPVHGDDMRFRDDPNWRDLVLFYEYFHGDSGRGVGASHQTGWTGLVAKLLQQSGERVENAHGRGTGSRSRNCLSVEKESYESAGCLPGHTQLTPSHRARETLGARHPQRPRRTGSRAERRRRWHGQGNQRRRIRHGA